MASNYNVLDLKATTKIPEKSLSVTIKQNVVDHIVLHIYYNYITKR